MKKSSLNNFKKFAISTSETINTKGGIFCELYIGYVGANGQTINNGQMQKAMNLDAIMIQEGLAAAMQKGGANYVAKYS
jgi:hypothetical protein